MSQASRHEVVDPIRTCNVRLTARFEKITDCSSWEIHDRIGLAVHDHGPQVVRTIIQNHTSKCRTLEDITAGQAVGSHVKHTADLAS